MTKAIFRRTLDGFVPASDEAQALMARTKLGDLVTLTGRKERNLQHHRLFFAMLRMISENSNPPISEATALHFAKLATGTGEVVEDSRGQPHFVPGTISFAGMNQDEFKAFVQQAIPPLVARFMVGTAPQVLIDEAMQLAR